MPSGRFLGCVVASSFVTVNFDLEILIRCELKRKRAVSGLQISSAIIKANIS